MNLQTIKNRQAERGFTIVELLIVIVVIAILAAISIVAYTGVQDRARNSSAQQTASQVASKANAYYAVEGSYPTTAVGNATGSFNSIDVAELEGVTVTDGSGAITAGSGDGWTAGTAVVYYPNNPSGGYTVVYRDSSATAASSPVDIAGVGAIIRQ